MSRRTALLAALAVAVGPLAAATATADAPPSAGRFVGPVSYRAVPATDVSAGATTVETGRHGPGLELASHLVPSLAREPALAVDRDGTVFFDAKAGSAPAGGAPHLIFRSRDGGQTWQDVSGNAVQRQLFFTAADPDVEVDADTGRVFWAGIAIPRPAVFAFSADSGETWTTTEAYSVGANDHETVVTGRVPAGSSLTPTDPTFPKIVYYCANSFYVVSCARSLDGGLTFVQVPGRPLADQGLANCGAETGFMSTDDAGRVFIGGANCGTPQISVSEDAGDTWTDVTVSSAIPAYGHDVEVAADAAGNVYALWTGTNRLPYIAVSRDHGRTFGPALLVSAPGVQETGFAALAAGDEGRIVVSYVGTLSGDRNDTHRPWSYFVAVTTDALDDAPLFSTNVAPTPSGTSVVNRGDCCPGMYDYLDVDVAPTPTGTVWASLSNVCSAACATSDAGVDDVYPGQGFAVEQVAGPSLRGGDRGVGVGQPQR